MTHYAADRHSAFFRRNLQAIGTRTEGGLSSLDALIGIPLTPVAIDEAWVRHQMLGQPPEVALRRFRNLLMMALIERDVRGEAPLEEVLGAITHWAEVSVRHALQVAATELQEQGRTLLDSRGRPQDMLVVGMGKLGGGELNVSSDIDLIYVARDAGEEPRYLERIARRLGQLLSNVTADGFVFRVDTRLRPYGDVGPLIATLPALGSYFHEQGREWERFAWLKGRVIAHTGLAPFDSTRGDEQQLMQQVVPFVFRPYLDFPAFTALAKLHDMIRTEAGKTESRRARSDNAGFDVKLGRGGIREIEFCAQMFQIVRGGQDPSLRERSTPKALQRLARRRLLDESDVEQLLSAWRLLRRTEHALQYQEDAQTHWLSDDAAQHTAIAAMLGMSTSEFDARLNDARNHVARVFDELLAPSRMTGFEAAPENTATQASGVGTSPLPSPAEAPAPSPESTDAPPTEAEPAAQPAATHDPESQRRIEALRESRAYRKARDTSQQKVEHLLGQALHFQPGPESCGPTALIGRLCDFLESIAGRSVYLDMLIQHPGAFLHLLRMMAQARWASDYLRSHPVVIDELANGQLLEPLDIPHWTQELREQLDATVLAGVLDDDGRPAPDIERQMDAMREAHHGAVFRLLGQDLEKRLTVEVLSDHLSALADAVLEVTLERCWANLPRRHRPDPQFAVIAYGRLGGKELGYSSDLDLVFLYDDPHEDAPRIYAQLAQRMAGWLQTRTAAGTLFEVDLRLRPNGNAGLLVSSQNAFRVYQTESAWVWEHQALTRARYAAGSPTIGSAFETLRADILARPRDEAALRAEILSMRQKMHDGHPNNTGLFDLKHDAGGMVDIEFMVQYLVLAHSHQHPALIENKGNIELLRRAASAGLIPPEAGKAVGDAYRRYRRLQHEIRLNDAERARVPPATVAVEAGAVKALWQHLFS
ncbi:MAG: bifunctional [glutamate--ammonia ligase]-adenylyl-L-tyrosine phosphorylase/[glutamate--ammonia-ligase] adenylyltransferase [Lautropia mirabilis]